MIKIIKQFIEYLRGIFNNDSTVEIVNEPNDDCNHSFTGWRYVKGGGRSRVCKLCGHVEHVD